MKNLSDMNTAELTEFCQRLAEEINQRLPDDARGFLLLVAGSDDVCQYVGTCDREEGIKWMKETVARMEHRDIMERITKGRGG